MGRTPNQRQTEAATTARPSSNQQARSPKASQNPRGFRPQGKERLDSAGFIGLWLTQWLTAINDNAFRWLVVGIAKDWVEPAQHSLVLIVGLGLFVVPYLLFACHAGYLADRFTKRNVVLAGKFVECLVLLLGIVAIYLENLPLLFSVVALMGTQSALFAPAKMGLLPEMMSADRISAANGWFGLSTVTATIVGMGLGGWLADATHPHGSQHTWLIAVALLGSALLGTATACLVPRYSAANPRRRFPWMAHRETLKDLQTLASRMPLFMVAMGIVFFWSIAAIAQFNIDQFASEAGTYYESERTPLLLSLVLGVGIGSVLAGLLSAGRIELGMIPPSLAVLAICSMLLVGLDRPFFHIALPTWELGPLSVPWNGDLFWAMFLLLGMGIAAGVFDVPLAAYLQHRSAAHERGAVLSAANFCIFSGVLLSSLLMLGLRAPFHDGARRRVFEPLESVSPMVQHDLELDAERFASARRSTSRDASDAVSIETWMQVHPLSAPETQRFAHLLWAEVQARRELGETVIAVEYYDRYSAEDQRRIAKRVLLESGKLPFVSSRHIFLFLGIATLLVSALTFRWLPQATVRFLLGGTLRFTGCFRIPSSSGLPDGKVVVIVMNRCSRLGRLLLHMTAGRPLTEVRFEESGRERESVWDRWWGVLRIGSGPAARQEGMSKARRTLLHGGTLVIMPSHSLRQGEEMYPDDAIRITDGIKVDWVPVFVTESRRLSPTSSLWATLWAARKDPPVLSIGTPRPLEQREPGELRRWVEALGNRNMTTSVAAAKKPRMMPPAAFVHRCREKGTRTKIADTTGASLTGKEALLRTLILRRLLRRHVLQDQDRFVGVLLPPSVPAIVVNMALSIDRRVAVNLNYTSSPETLNACLKLCGIRCVLTSRKVMDKLNLKLDAQIIYLEDLREKVTLGDKVASFWNSTVRSAHSLVNSLGLNQIKPQDELTVIFTSGSTGVPKGVVLTMDNVASNVEAIRDVVKLDERDVLIGVLPLFHSFGYTVTMWGTMNLALSAVYHYSPLDAKQVGKMCKENKGTVLLATPTFLRNYLKRCKPEEFETLEIVVAGAEKLPQDLVEEFDAKFGVRPVEGYGTTELSPLVSVNVPATRDPNDGRVLRKEGTVGQPVPEVRVQVRDLDTQAILGPNQPGMLWVSGPNVMSGYLHRKDLTDEVLVDGWYRTGDVAMIDQDNFIHITGRVSRFSKIGGEMVPHIQVEEELTRIVDETLRTRGQADQGEGYPVTVTSVPDERKGERLIVLYTPLGVTVDEMRSGLQAAGLPPLYIPGADSFFEVEKVPVLGTGKLDLKAIQDLAKEKAGT